MVLPRGLCRHHVDVLVLLVELLRIGREEQVCRVVCFDELEDVGLLCRDDNIGGCRCGLLFVVDIVVFKKFLMERDVSLTTEKTSGSVRP